MHEHDIYLPDVGSVLASVALKKAVWLALKKAVWLEFEDMAV